VNVGNDWGDSGGQRRVSIGKPEEKTGGDSSTGGMVLARHESFTAPLEVVQEDGFGK
jgi:hypothetical protein